MMNMLCACRHARYCAVLTVAALMASTALAHDGEHPEPVEPKEKYISFEFGVDWNSHFMLYGYDIWAAGSSWDESTFNPWAQVTIDRPISDDVSISFFAGTWWDVNDNAEVAGTDDSLIGGELQEVDVWLGVGTTIGDWSFALTYQHWYYGSQNEQVLDIDAAYDDSSLWGDSGFALNPSARAHILIADGVVSQPRLFGRPRLIKDAPGVVFVLGVEPSFTLYEGDSIDVELSVPANIGIGNNDYFAEAGLAYFSIGAQFSIPMKFIPEEYGSWAIGTGVTYYFVDEEKVPTNPEEHIVAGNIGFSVSF